MTDIKIEHLKCFILEAEALTIDHAELELTRSRIYVSFSKDGFSDDCHAFKASPFGLQADKVPHSIDVKQGNVPKAAVQMFAAVIHS